MADFSLQEGLSELNATADVLGDFDDSGTSDGMSSEFTAPVMYPRYVAVLAIIGFGVATAGFTLSLVFVTVWPVTILIAGLVLLWLCSLAARRAEKKTGHVNIDVWQRFVWDSTRLPSLPPQVDRTSPTA